MAYFTTRDGCRLFYRVKSASNDRPWIIFLNGTTQTALQWLPTVRAFQDTCNILIYDARAQGKSALGERPLDLDLHAADLQELMGHLEIGAASLVGLSHGALVGLKLAVKAPEAVLKLVLCSMGLPTSAFNRVVLRSWLEVLHRGGLEALAWAMLPETLGPAFLTGRQSAVDEMVKAVVYRNRRDRLEAHLKAVLSYPPLAEWIATAIPPCLLVNGGDDRLADAEAVGRMIGPALVETVTLTGCGHSFPLEAPQRFVARVKDFLFRLPQWRSEK